MGKPKPRRVERPVKSGVRLVSGVVTTLTQKDDGVQVRRREVSRGILGGERTETTQSGFLPGVRMEQAKVRSSQEEATVANAAAVHSFRLKESELSDRCTLAPGGKSIRPCLVVSKGTVKDFISWCERNGVRVLNRDYTDTQRAEQEVRGPSTVIDDYGRRWDRHFHGAGKGTPVPVDYVAFESFERVRLRKDQTKDFQEKQMERFIASRRDEVCNVWYTVQGPAEALEALRHQKFVVAAAKAPARDPNFARAAGAGAEKPRPAPKGAATPAVRTVSKMDRLDTFRRDRLMEDAKKGFRFQMHGVTFARPSGFVPSATGSRNWTRIEIVDSNGNVQLAEAHVDRKGNLKLGRPEPEKEELPPPDPNRPETSRPKSPEILPRLQEG